jgi:hypothetical protein
VQHWRQAKEVVAMTMREALEAAIRLLDGYTRRERQVAESLGTWDDPFEALREALAAGVDVDAVAKAIYDDNSFESWGKMTPWDVICEKAPATAEGYRRAARAVINHLGLDAKGDQDA